MLHAFSLKTYTTSTQQLQHNNCILNKLTVFLTSLTAFLVSLTFS